MIEELLKETSYFLIKNDQIIRQGGIESIITRFKDVYLNPLLEEAKRKRLSSKSKAIIYVTEMKKEVIEHEKVIVKKKGFLFPRKVKVEKEFKRHYPVHLNEIFGNNAGNCPAYAMVLVTKADTIEKPYVYFVAIGCYDIKKLAKSFSYAYKSYLKELFPEEEIIDKIPADAVLIQ